jgi:hypothetical protein
MALDNTLEERMADSRKMVPATAMPMDWKSDRE